MTATKTLVLTGGAKRIGKALVLAFHKQGFNVCFQYRHSETEALALCELLNSKRNNSAFCFQCNLNDQTSLEQFIQKVNQSCKTIDLLINNASDFYPTPIQEASEKDWHALMDSNLKAPFFLAQAFSQKLKEAKGNIINLVDIYGDKPLKQHSIYSVSKAGLIMLTKSLALELAPDIRVNAIAPGAILWPENGQDNQQEILEKVALQRIGSEKDIVDAALYLNSATYVTGQIIQVDGGRSLNI